MELLCIWDAREKLLWLLRIRTNIYFFIITDVIVSFEIISKFLFTSFTVTLPAVIQIVRPFVSRYQSKFWLTRNVDLIWIMFISLSINSKKVVRLIKSYNRWLFCKIFFDSFQNFFILYAFKCLILVYTNYAFF